MNSQKALRWTAIPGVLSGLLFVIYAYAPFSFLKQPPTLLDKLWFLGMFLALFWLAGIYGVQKKEIKRLGLIGTTACWAALCLLDIWIFRRVVMEQPLKSDWWVDLACLLMVWGILALGTLTLKANRFPRPATALWMSGFALICSGWACRWSGTYILIGLGMIWSSCCIWFDQKAKQEATSPPMLTPEKGVRFEALDLLRGLIMILMPIDHANMLLRQTHFLEIWNSPAPFYPNAAEFLTRFITHFCAPGFFFLMGAGMVLFAESRRRIGWSQGKIMGHLALRGLLFIVLEKILWDPLLYGSLQFTKFGVFYGLGTAMIFGVLFLRFNRSALLGFGIGGLIVTQIVPPLFAKLGIYYHPLAYLFLVPQAYGSWFVIYPTLPWLSVTLLGMLLAKELLFDSQRAFRLALFAGIGFLILFTVVRIIGGFGNFQPVNGSGWIDFLNVVKYPPSLVFTLLTLGVDLILLYLFTRAHHFFTKWRNPLPLFGKTALYFYFAHWLLLGALGSVFYFFKFKSLPLMYLGWALVLLLLYPICRQYLDFKQKTAPDSVWRFI
jgi:uncharacterized membrane protein